MSEKYYYSVVNGSCTKTCKFRENEIKIGSLVCKSCPYILDSNTSEGWIKCGVLIVAAK